MNLSQANKNLLTISFILYCAQRSCVQQSCDQQNCTQNKISPNIFVLLHDVLRPKLLNSPFAS